MRLRKRVDRLEKAASDDLDNACKPMNYNERELSRTLRQTMDRVFRLEVRMQQAEDRLQKLENPSAAAWTAQQAFPVPESGKQYVVLDKLMATRPLPAWHGNQNMYPSGAASDSACQASDTRGNAES